MPSVVLDRYQESVLLGVTRLVRSYPAVLTGPLVAVSADEALPGLRARFDSLDAARKRAARRGIAWWGQHVDLVSSVERAQTSLRQAMLAKVPDDVLESVVTACSVAVAESVPRVTGANGSVAALWLSGFAGTGVSPWRRG